MQKLKYILLITLVSLNLSAQQQTSQPMREFITATTYGVLAGTLVGAASLAFTEQPGENLQRVARGASLGLYAGIFLGLYIVYVVPSAYQRELEYNQIPIDANAIPKVFPLFKGNKIDGMAASIPVYRF
ncbi:MAG: hypothetical protein MK008_10520 [Bdellovibrionales bacterium]|nr:hypothetical protein [Bdellovibrionales bacterium]